MGEERSCLFKHRGAGPVLCITPGERDTLQLLAKGHTGNELSRRSGLSPAEIDAMLDELFAALGAATQAEAIAAARKRGLLTPEPVRVATASA